MDVSKVFRITKRHFDWLAQQRIADKRSRPAQDVIAVLIAGGGRYIVWNDYKTHPAMKRASQGAKECLHAEVRMIQLCRSLFRMDIPSDAKMFVLRRNRLGKFCLAKPCKHCDWFIRNKAPILKVYYTNKDGEFERL